MDAELLGPHGLQLLKPSKSCSRVKPYLASPRVVHHLEALGGLSPVVNMPPGLKRQEMVSGM